MKNKTHLFNFLCCIIVSLFFVLSSLAQNESVKATEALKYVGETKTVCGKAVSTHFASSSKGQPTFLNLDKPHPNHIFTVVIWGSDRSKFKEAPEKTYKDKQICVTGAIKVYRGKPEIAVNSPDKITIQK